jgi:hypothetical protein
LPFPNPPSRARRASRSRFHRRGMAAMVLALYAPGREDRISTAEAKRDRKNAKRAREAEAIVRSTCASGTR